MRERFAEAVESTLRDVDDVEKSLVSCVRQVVRADAGAPMCGFWQRSLEAQKFRSVFPREA
jgi:hypothetical protein